MKIIYRLLLVILSINVSCSNEDVVSNDSKLEKSKIANENSFASREGLKTIGTGVMMQAFYWDVPAGGTWWQRIEDKVDDWSEAGIDAIWLPPASKAQNGAFSMGYDPFDYYDFGEYDQMGSTETRFGSRSELESLISRAHRYNLNVIADIVINHNSGGDKESNEFVGKSTYTEFNPLSGKFHRTKYDFHPNDKYNSDSGFFGGFPDLSHKKPYVQDWLWKKSNSVAKYYKNTMKFDGWRFDYVKGFEPWVARQFNQAVGGFAVGEYWDGNVDDLKWWTDKAEMSAFDFGCYYKMRDAFMGNDLNALSGDMLWKRSSTRAVTFVANHDTDEIINNKILAYAYILTHEGYPAIFYRDYEDWLSKSKMNNLIWIHNNLAGGSTTNLWTDNDEYIAKRNGGNGKKGLIVYINNSNSWKERWVETNWSNKRIKDYTGSSSWQPVTQSGKWVKIQAPPKGYTVWSTK